MESTMRSPWRVLPALLLIGAIPCVSGCGGSEKTSASEDKGTEVKSAGVGAPPADDRDAEVRKDSTGRKWYGEIPYDVWIAEPTAVAANNTPVGGGPTTPGDGGPMVDPSPTAPDPMPMASGGGGNDDWGRIIPADVVAAEVKDVQNRLNKAMTSVAQYNQEHLALPPYLHSMAAMAAIGAEHPGDIRWKENAPLIRDLVGRITAQGTPMTGARGKKAMEEHYLPLVDVFAGSPPAGLEPASDVLYSDVAEMGELMKRLDIAFLKRLAVEVGGEEALAEKKDLVRHEASVIAALGKVITLEGYGYLDDNDFKTHARGIIDGGIQMVEAAEEGDFAKFDAAKTLIDKSCNDCHRTYK